jgi:DnaJ-class molecular chaperone
MITVYECAEGEDRSSFSCETRSSAKRMRMSCSSDDSECCTKALRLVSGSDSAVHPRDWSNEPTWRWARPDIVACDSCNGSGKNVEGFRCWTCVGNGTLAPEGMIIKPI